MTSKIGTTESGFSMIELMITVAFVTLGSLLIQGSFLRSAEMFGRYSDSLKIMSWMNEQSAKVKEGHLYSGGAFEGRDGGEIELSGRSFSWTRELVSLDLPDLSSIRISARWTESGKPMELKNELYVYKKDPFAGS